MEIRDTICERAYDRFQVYDEYGNVRLCGWAKDQYIGSLLENSVEELYCGKRATDFRNRHLRKDYSLCKKDACPYLAQDSVDKHSVPYEERRLPKQIAIGYERVCNYACRCCFIHNVMVKNNANKELDLERNYQIIEDRIKEAMPYMTRISANGCGELFVSKHTMRLLNEWKPVAPPEECYVDIETNGSLFDEEHWKMIDNIGKYNVSVAITIMSFHEDVYRYLSGCSYPISRIENNLKFVKGLREQGLINHLELATVVQEQNFREMPEFTRRCLDEFGADSVRLRPYEPWGTESREEAWFKDIRVPDHPLHDEYKKVMSNEIFKNKKVHDWGGGNESEWIHSSPYKQELENEELMAEIVAEKEKLLSKIKKRFGSAPVVVYGFEPMGKILSRVLLDLNCNMPYIICYKEGPESFFGTKIVKLSDLNDNYDRNVNVIITPMHAAEKIRNVLCDRGYVNVITVRELLSSE